MGGDWPEGGASGRGKRKKPEGAEGISVCGDCLGWGGARGRAERRNERREGEGGWRGRMSEEGQHRGLSEQYACMPFGNVRMHAWGCTTVGRRARQSLCKGQREGGRRREKGREASRGDERLAVGATGEVED